MLKRSWLFSIIVLVIVGVVGSVIIFRPKEPTLLLPTYFHYSNADLASFKSYKPIGTISVNDLQKWDVIMFDLVRTHGLGDEYAGEVYADLYTAQRDAAYLSYNNHQSFAGTLDAVSRGILCVKFPKDCENLPPVDKKDLYSNTIADIVLEKIKARENLIQQQDKMNYAEKVNDEYWAGNRPYYGQAFGSWQPWLIKSASE